MYIPKCYPIFMDYYNTVPVSQYQISNIWTRMIIR